MPRIGQYAIKTNEKHRPCGCDTRTAVKTLERLINANFTDNALILPDIRFQDQFISNAAKLGMETIQNEEMILYF